MDISKLKTQTNFTKLVGSHNSRINLLISMGKLEVVEIDGLAFVINSAKNRAIATPAKRSNKK